MSSKLSESFYLSMVKFLLHAKQDVVACSTELGLSSMQAFTILLADTHEPQSMNYFRKLYDCDPSNITGIVDGLEEKGLVSRKEHPNDRRIKDVVLTSKGEALRDKLLHRLAAIQAFRFSGLSDEEQLQLTLIIEKVVSRTTSGLAQPKETLD